MRISALAEATDVPVPTLKYYLREGLLHGGRTTSRTQAEYDESHVERVRLVRALTGVGGLSLATARRVLETVESGEVERIGVLATAQRSLLGEDNLPPTSCGAAPGLSPDGEPVARPSRALDWLTAQGWMVYPDDPMVEQLDAAWRACDDAGIGLDEERLARYAEGVLQIAETDVDAVPAEPAAAARQVVLGTVLLDPVLSLLRRLAQQHVAVTRYGPEI